MALRDDDDLCCITTLTEFALPVDEICVVSVSYNYFVILTYDLK